MNVKAYAFIGKDHLLRAALINKEPSTDVEVRLISPKKFTHVSAMRLRAPSLESKSGVTLGDTEVLASGRWEPGWPERLTVRGSECIVHLPRASAAIVRLQV
jgi:Glycosyl hydrolase family 79 C-terminal beta domain